jgi:hypothetical protein
MHVVKAYTQEEHQIGQFVGSTASSKKKHGAGQAPGFDRSSLGDERPHGPVGVSYGGFASCAEIC